MVTGAVPAPGRCSDSNAANPAGERREWGFVRRRYLFWGVQHGRRTIALLEDLTAWAEGETFWQALGHLSKSQSVFTPSAEGEETGAAKRYRLFQETGIQQVEIFVCLNQGVYEVSCANSRSRLSTADGEGALREYIRIRAETSTVNRGDMS